jgi:hypothetical protein
MTTQELYRTDSFEWTQRNAELLSRGCFELADIPHIAEELADMGQRDQRQVKSYVRRLILQSVEMADAARQTEHEPDDKHRQFTIRA